MSIKHATLGSMLLFSSALYSQTVYTWVDDDGTLHFNDTPQSSHAKALNLPSYEQPALAPEYEKSTPAEPTTKKPPSPELDKVKSAELTLAIVSPTDDQALRSNNGDLSIQGELNRKLLPGEQLQLTINGKNFEAPSHTPTWQLKNLDRGSHSFAIQAFRDGKLIASSLPITVHIKRVSVK